MKIQQSAKQEVSLWPVLLPCLAAGIAALLLSSAGCGSTANSADSKSASEPTPGDAQPSTALGKTLKRVAAGGRAYTAVALLRVEAKTPVVGFAPPRLDDVLEYDLFLGTQMVLLKSRFVLTKALEDPEVKKLNLGARVADPVAWLTDQTRTSRPGKAEIIEVSLGSDDGDEAKTLLSAVVNAYLTEVVDVEVRQLKSRLDRLDRAMKEHTDRIRARRSELRDFADKFGMADRQASGMRQKLATESFAFWQKETMRLDCDLRQAKADLEASKEQAEITPAAAVSESDVDKLANSDPVTVQVLLPLLLHVKKSLLEAQAATKPAPDGTGSASLQRQLQDIQSQIAARREELRKRLRQEVDEARKVELKVRERKVGAAEVAHQRASAELDKRRSELERLSGAAIDLEMLRNEIDQMEQLLKNIADERERLYIAAESPPRVRLVQRVEVVEGR